MNCNYCGVPLPENARHCPQCGKPLYAKNTVTLSPTLKRALLFLEEGNIGKADDYCEQALDLDPENPYAYVIKLMIRVNAKKEADLANAGEAYGSWSSYQNAIRFADPVLRQRLEYYLQCTEEALRLKAEQEEQARREHQKLVTYQKACKYSTNINSIQSIKEAILLFKKIPDYEDVAQRIPLCKKQLEFLVQKKQRKDTRDIVILVCTIILTLGILIATGWFLMSHISKTNAQLEERIYKNMQGNRFVCSYQTDAGGYYYGTKNELGNGPGVPKAIYQDTVVYTFRDDGSVYVDTTSYYTKNPYTVIDGQIQWESTSTSSKTYSDYSIKVIRGKATISIGNSRYELNLNSHNYPTSFTDGKHTYTRN